MKKNFLITVIICLSVFFIGFSVLRNITEEEQVAIIEAWFSSPYEYMFEGELYNDNSGNSLQYLMDGKHQFMAGVDGIVFYGGLHRAFKKVFDLSSDAYESVEILSGIECFSQTVENDNTKFNYLNPEIVKWLYIQIPDKNLKIRNYTCKEIYQTIFSRLFRMHVKAYYYVNYDNNKDKIIEQYQQVMYVDDYNLNKLEDLYDGALPEFDTYRDGTNLTPAMAIGFWVRREIDGSADELWKYLKKFMRKYDKKWFKELKNNN